MIAIARMPGRILEAEREQWLSVPELERRQWSRFRRVLEHAYERSAFYRRRFGEAGIRPDDIRGPSDLAKIPILARADLVRAEGIVAGGFDAGRLHASISSGSTGECVQTYFDDEAWLLGKYVLKLRARRACGLSIRDRIVVFQSYPPADTLLRRRLLRQISLRIDDDLEAAAGAVRRFRATVLYGPPGYLARLAEAAPDLRPRIVFTSGEMIEGNRRPIRDAWGSAVFDVYGSTETKEIAWECPEGAGYHVNADWLLVETIETEGAGGRAGGEVVVTSLANFGMPLIRYRLGDTARFLPHACPCGRSLPLLAPLLGRAVDYFALPNGGAASPYSIVNAIEALPGIARFQVVQETLDRAVVRLVPGPDFGDEPARRIRAELRRVLPGMEIDIEVCPSIEPEAGGKFRIVRSKIGETGSERAAR